MNSFDPKYDPKSPYMNDEEKERCKESTRFFTNLYL